MLSKGSNEWINKLSGQNNNAMWPFHPTGNKNRMGSSKYQPGESRQSSGMLTSVSLTYWNDQLTPQLHYKNGSGYMYYITHSHHDFIL